ncbi:hypothetical protein [Hymenobacter pini]|uniref:hypothetical protein n=1 Tax=Hymenobacter pini TaxID=2880879 RepID=UPI001CF30444|nr:hypothetical protein [Hymenobacter pini]MCA8830196.1 hypothetical protein [Hymenobacter pini]
MKRILLAAGGLLSLFMASTTPLSSTVETADMQSVSEHRGRPTGQDSLTLKQEANPIAFSARPDSSFIRTHFRDVSGPRRVKYGNRRWVQLS